jgi:hypothetical protein
MPAANDVGEPCAGEPHARFDGREPETEHPGQGHGNGTAGTKAAGPTSRNGPPRQFPTLHRVCAGDEGCGRPAIGMSEAPGKTAVCEWCLSSGCSRGGLHEPEELACGVALEAAQDLLRSQSLGGAADDVGGGSGMFHASSGGDDRMQGGVEGSVAAAVETVALMAARAGG